MAATHFTPSSTEAIESLSGNPYEAFLARLLASRQFARAPLLSAFLRYVCERTWQDASARPTEQEIGVNVFRRPVGYDAGADNIVRNYARQLRKRLEEYYATEGAGEDIRIDIPRGGYVPVFSPREKADVHAELCSQVVCEPEFERDPVLPGTSPLAPEATRGTGASRSRWIWTAILAAGIYSAALVAATLYVAHNAGGADKTGSRLHAVWECLFRRDKDTFIVPADTGFVVVQQLSNKTFSLAEYASWSSIEQYDHTYISYLKSQKYTSVLDMSIASKLQSLPEVVPDRFVVRAPRNMRLEDLNDGNAILIGSVFSNPWVEAFRSYLNFQFVYQPEDDRSWIVNQHPGRGESAEYRSSWNTFSHKTYATLAFLPNLARTGHVLLIQGLDSAGTKAAAGALFESDALRETLQKARGENGSIGGFEVLLEASALDDHADAAHVLATRIYR